MLGGIIVTIYFTAGGLLSSAWVNLVQVIVKACGFCLAVPWALSGIGGWQAISRAVAAATRRSTAERYLSITGIGLEGILRYAVILIPSFIVSPGLIQKLYGARDESTVRNAVGAQGVVPARLLFPARDSRHGGDGALSATRQPGLALPKLLAEGLPPWLGGLMLAAIFSAEVSSADAVLFMLTTSVARDLVQTAFRRDLSDRVCCGRRASPPSSPARRGIVLRLWLQSILAALEIFYSLLAVSLFVPLLAGLYSSRPTAARRSPRWPPRFPPPPPFICSRMARVSACSHPRRWAFFQRRGVSAVRSRNNPGGPRIMGRPITIMGNRT